MVNGTLHRRLSHQPGGSWTPNDLGTQRFWCDADQLTGLSDGDDVGTWDDVYTTALDFTQSTATNKPHYRTGILNGKPVVDFDGSNHYLQTANTTDLNDVDGDLTFWCVYQLHVLTPALSCIFFKGNAASAAGTTFEFINWNGYQATYWQSAVSTSSVVLNSTSTEDTNWHYAVVQRNGSSWDYYEDGSLVETNTLAGSTNDAGYKPTLGATSGGAWKMNGYIAEVGMVAEYSSSHRSNLETYLTNKWGL